MQHFLNFAVAVLLGRTGIASAKGGAALRAAKLSDTTLRNSLNIAIGEALGCGDHVDQVHLVKLEQELYPLWSTLPKTSDGRVERRTLRYLVHRYFSRRSALHVRGFEPARPVSKDGWSDIDILSQKVPSFVESVLESKHRSVNGFSLQDSVLMIATLEQLIFDSESSLLERVYGDQQRSIFESLSGKDAVEVLEAYIIHWMMGEDQAGIRVLLSNRTLLETAFPNWQALQELVQGEIKSLAHFREQAPVAAFAQHSSRKGHNALAQQYSFDDVHRIVGGITRSFAFFWESECSSMKHTLVKMDVHNTGRVPLSSFYNSALETDWRFGESESYLRELGALDETSSWRGKQVIISNYIQSTSNCIVSSPHYSVCCFNDCEAHLAEIEDAVGAPTASPDQLLAIVGNLSSHLLLDDAVPDIRSSLRSQLTEIAVANGGEVPLHGRLFAQWLHFIFPRECAYPHKIGTASVMSPMEYGDGYFASREDMEKQASEANSSEVTMGMVQEDAQWMSQWSPEEELITDLAPFNAPWETPANKVFVGAIVLALAIALYGKVGHQTANCVLLPTHGKSHFV